MTDEAVLSSERVEPDPAPAPTGRGSSPFDDGQATDEARAADLRRMKAVATSLLVLAAIVFVVARVQEGEEAWAGWGYVRATAEAGMVGALADWFAVTALFRHPLRLPIPHTAIVRRRKDQIGASLGGFVQDNFLTRAIITERLGDADLGRRLGNWLSEPGNARTVGDQGAAVVRGLTEVLSDDVVQQGLEAVVVERARGIPVSPLIGRAVDVAVEGDHHQQLFDTVVRGVDRFLGDNATSLRNRMTQESPWWVPEAVDDVVFDKIYSSVRRFLREVADDSNHELRLSVDERSAALAEDLKTSPAMLARGEEIKEEILAHPEVRAWSANLWASLKAALLEATEDPESQLRLRIEEALVDAGRSLERDPELRAKVEHWIVDGIGYVAEQFRGEVSNLIATTVQRWDADETADRIELQVGRDLQFIRINGTVVGGLAGLVIYTLSELFL
ncbi:MAG: DUF445 domain-containing protein [Actinomycetota bacterium]